MDTSTPVLPSLRLGVVPAGAAAAGVLRGGDGPRHTGPRHRHTGQSHGLDEIPARNAGVFAFRVHGSHLIGL